jgi:Fe2+ transport system protein FeoA
METSIHQMNEESTITCSMCGYTYISSQHKACQGCPINQGCSMVCCPKCGFEMIDPQKSAGYKIVTRIRNRFNHKRNLNHHRVLSLIQGIPGKKVRISGFNPQIDPERRARLQAYGVNVGQIVTIIQHAPVTIVLIEHLELAIESDLAHKIQIETESP